MSENIQWKTENSNSESVLFYFLPQNTKERRDEFEKRISSSKYKKCYVNYNFSKKPNIEYLETSLWHEELKERCNKIYPLPNSHFIAVTGTNGKTTTTDIIRQLLISSDKTVLTIGTLGVWHNNTKVQDYNLTTPNYIDIRKCLSEYVAEYIVIEASSHALEQNRFNGIVFDYSVWTSFSQDHLDYHKTMEEYFLSKRRLIDITDKKILVCEDEVFLDKLPQAKVSKVSLLIYELSDYFSISYNRKNLSLAISLLNEFNIVPSKMNIEDLKSTPGRFNLIRGNNQLIVIDFAHTPDALINIGKELKTTYKDKKIITVMGCGGDRDPLKRPLMGAACEDFSDFVFITSDNPRFEDPQRILKDIEKGMIRNTYELELIRSQAIRKAISTYDNSIILIAGKGHENYIDQNGTKTYYSDEEEVKKVLNDLR